MIRILGLYITRHKPRQPLPIAVFSRQAPDWQPPAGDGRAVRFAGVKRLPNYHRNRLDVERQNRAELHRVLGQ